MAAARPSPSSDPHAAYLARARFAPLDGLRALSVLPVVLFHAAPAPPGGPVGRGPLGVDMFFALSGFLITSRLLRERERDGAIDLGAFWIRRALRIFPLYFAVLGAYAAYAAWGLPDASPTRAHFFESLPFYATYTTNLFVAFDVSFPVLFAFSWSLAVEEQFYVVWPPLLRASRRGHVPWVAALVALALVLGAQTFAPLGARLPLPIVLGAAAAITLHDRRGFALLGRALGAPPVACALVLGAVATFFFDVPLALAHLTFALLVAAAAVAPPEGVLRGLNAAPLRFVGEISYGVYLLHVSAIALVRRAAPNVAESTGIVFLLAIAVTIPLAWASHRGFERPLTAMRGRRRTEPVPPHAAEVGLTPPAAT